MILDLCSSRCLIAPPVHNETLEQAVQSFSLSQLFSQLNPTMPSPRRHLGLMGASQPQMLQKCRYADTEWKIMRVGQDDADISCLNLSDCWSALRMCHMPGLLRRCPRLRLHASVWETHAQRSQPKSITKAAFWSSRNFPRRFPYGIVICASVHVDPIEFKTRLFQVGRSEVIEAQELRFSTC